MSKLLAECFKWIGRKAVILFFVLVVLVAAAWVKGEWDRMAEIRNGLSERKKTKELLEQQTRDLRAEAERLSGKLAQEFTEKSRAAAAAARRLEAIKLERQQLWDENWVARKIPVSEVSKKLMALDALIMSQEKIVQTAQRLKAEVQQSPQFQSISRQIEQLDRHLADVTQGIAQDEQALSESPTRRLLDAIHSQLPTALGILAGIILLPIALKALLYFAIAPLVAKFKPICVFPESSGIVHFDSRTKNSPGMGNLSGVSQEINLDESTELLVHADFLQSCSRAAEKRTQWFLDASIPFSSIAAGLIALVRIRSREPVVVSSLKEPLAEIGIIELPEGSALVCQPRALAGVIKKQGQSIKITRHWRIASLHSWLTFQLRFLVFHGPCKLIIKGCRGIRAESGESARLINQAATLGFSSNLHYANTRCETFVSYWTGKEDLFNDLFSGSPGIYIYEEMPDAKRKTGVTGRGIEGMMDAALKVFGI